VRRDTCGMPIRPLSSPSHDRLHTPKQEPVSGSVSSPSNKIRHSSSKHKKQLQHDKRSSSKVSAAAEESDNVTAALTWKEQLGQILAILVVATLVYYSTSVTIQWLQEASKPFCDDKESLQVMVSGDCIPCPENGQCRNGRLQCLPGFRQHGRSCVPDKEVDRNAQELVHFAAAVVVFLCKEIHQRISFFCSECCKGLERTKACTGGYIVVVKVSCAYSLLGLEYPYDDFLLYVFKLLVFHVHWSMGHNFSLIILILFLLLQLPSFFFHFCSQEPANKHESLLLLTKSP
jgi:hypothetical protein